MNITTDFGSINKLVQLWQQAPDITREEVRRAVTEADLLLQGELQHSVARGAGGRHGAGIAGSIFREEHTLGDNVIGLVATNQSYAEYREVGTKPHMPPITPIEDWVQAVLGLRGEDAEGAAYAIRWKIFHHGTKGDHVWQKTYQRLYPKVQGFFVNAVARIERRLAAGLT